jgi:hypothetical protein
MLRGPVYTYFANDHVRLDWLLKSTAPETGEIDVDAFAAFRAGILRHIWQEERLLLPAIERGQNGQPFEHAGRLRLDHGAIAALLVPPPSVKTVAVLRHILVRHNPVEENPGGLYELCESLVGDRVTAFLNEVQAAPEIPTLPFNDDPGVLSAVQRAVARAGYDAISRRL